MHASVTIDVDAPPERVWAVMTNVAAWPQWTASVTEATRLDSGHFDVGSRVRIRQPRLPVAVWTVEQVESGRSFTWVTGLPDHWPPPRRAPQGGFAGHPRDRAAGPRG